MSSEKKIISLLRYALDSSDVDKSKYWIGVIGDEKKVSDSLCLLKDGDFWLVAYSERGTISEKSTHSSLRVAAKDFYARLAVEKTPWSFRHDWESETGEAF